jgi:hypothetical protein
MTTRVNPGTEDLGTAVRVDSRSGEEVQIDKALQRSEGNFASLQLKAELSLEGFDCAMENYGRNCLESKLNSPIHNLDKLILRFRLYLALFYIYICIYIYIYV